MQIPTYSLLNYFKLTLNVLRNSINCVEEARLNKKMLTEEETHIFSLEITRLKMIIMLYIFLFKYNMSQEELVELLGGDSFRTELLLTKGYINTQFTKNEKERILNKAFSLGESDFESVVLFKRARRVLATEMGEKYLRIFPLFDEVMASLKIEKSIKNCELIQMPTLSQT